MCLSRFIFLFLSFVRCATLVVIMDLLLLFSWPLMLRPHHLRALAILVTLVSLSLLFSTFSMRSGENRMWMMDPAGHQQQYTGGRVVMSAAVDPTSATATALFSKDPINVEEGSSSSSVSFTLTTTTAASSVQPSKRNHKLGVGEVYQITRKSPKLSHLHPAAVVKVICCSHFLFGEFSTITI